MKLLSAVLVLLVGSKCWAENGCFRSVGEAALRAGVRDEGGFRAEGVRRDFFSGVEWVRVVRCGRPEAPGVLVRGVNLMAHGGKAPHPIDEAETMGHPTSQSSDEPESMGHLGTRPVLIAGDAVRVVWADGAARGELAGVAVVSGALGARVRVRVEGFAKPDERLVSGVVRGAGVVELETGR